MPARDRRASAKALANLLGVRWSEADAGPFTGVHVNDTLTLDFGDAQTIVPQHFCFHVSDGEFDASGSVPRGQVWGWIIVAAIFSIRSLSFLFLAICKPIVRQFQLTVA